MKELLAFEWRPGRRPVAAAAAELSGTGDMMNPFSLSRPHIRLGRRQQAAAPAADLHAKCSALVPECFWVSAVPCEHDDVPCGPLKGKYTAISLS